MVTGILLNGPWAENCQNSTDSFWFFFTDNFSHMLLSLISIFLKEDIHELTRLLLMAEESIEGILIPIWYHSLVVYGSCKNWHYLSLTMCMLPLEWFAYIGCFNFSQQLYEVEGWFPHFTEEENWDTVTLINLAKSYYLLWSVKLRACGKDCGVSIFLGILNPNGWEGGEGRDGTQGHPQ